MSTPVGPYGKHARLQHSPPHVGSGTSGSYTAPPEQTSPALRHPPPPVASATVHTPSVASAAMVHLPAQHSVSVRQVSPIWMQYEGAGEQSPSTQYFEQQSPAPLQVFPEVRQPPFSGTQVPFGQLPPQHCSFDVHSSPSGV